MQKGLYNKKGISPLLATVLLIAATIAIGILVWLFYSRTVANLGEKEQCGAQEGISLSITGKLTCEGTNAVIETSNVGSEKVDAYWFVFTDTSGQSAASPTINPTKPGVTTTHNINRPSCPDSVEIIPGIVNTKNKKVNFCQDAKIQVARST